MRVAILKYNAGNVQSVTYALERLGIEPMLTDVPGDLHAADKVIFPGVGEASSAMRYLKNRGLDTVIKRLKQPFLGICLGMQLMGSYSEENDTECLGIFSEKISLFQEDPKQSLKVPHMGWNTINQLKTPLFDGLEENSYVYFVHSYYVEVGEHTIALSNHGIPFSAGVHKDNFYAVQFHPEKSEKIGAQILQNFIEKIH